MMTRKQFFQHLLLKLAHAATGDRPQAPPKPSVNGSGPAMLAFTELSPSLVAMEADVSGRSEDAHENPAALRRQLYARLRERARSSGGSLHDNAD
ncbi:hypothetical protein [Desulfatitalea alkaliphila]|uniref:Uncharacterized protein n=1 Tax=Desulfatitalea alkaliphila TaxID=2929485 RepID=A0AA41R2K6_9BACT|nr:hypothetical protein [Desulfatitalea alkaliphila]MCJ8501842.1 hypothetical protein [Desulfatitalea alkaliphila]